MNIKSWLKRIPPIFEINARYKAWRMLKQVDALRCEYDRVIEDMHQDEAERLARQALLGKFRAKPSTLRIVWVGANHAQDYSGFIQALGCFGTVEVFTQTTGKYGQRTCTEGRNIDKIREDNARRLLGIVEDKWSNGGIDLVIGQMWPHSMTSKALNVLRAQGIATVNINMDDRLPDLWRPMRGFTMGMMELASGLDLVLTSAPEAVKRYWHHGCPAVFWPMGSDPGLFKPALVKDINVSFVGNKYGIRGKLIDTLQMGGIDVKVFGEGWPLGPVGPETASDIFGRSKIILGIGTVAHCREYYTLKLRDFDATMAGALYLTNPTPELQYLFVPGVEIDFYTTPRDALDKVRYYLNHPKLIKSIGDAAAKKARQKHTWYMRIAQALDILGLRPKEDSSPQPIK